MHIVYEHGFRCQNVIFKYFVFFSINLYFHFETEASSRLFKIVYLYKPSISLFRAIVIAMSTEHPNSSLHSKRKAERLRRRKRLAESIRRHVESGGEYISKRDKIRLQKEKLRQNLTNGVKFCIDCSFENELSAKVSLALNCNFRPSIYSAFFLSLKKLIIVWLITGNFKAFPATLSSLWCK